MKRPFLFLLCLVTSGLVTSAQELVLVTPKGPQPLSQVINAEQVSGVYRDGSSELRLLALDGNKLKIEFKQ